MKNFVIEFETSDAYNCDTVEDAIKKCKEEHGDDIIITNIVD